MPSSCCHLCSPAPRLQFQLSAFQQKQVWRNTAVEAKKNPAAAAKAAAAAQAIAKATLHLTCNKVSQTGSSISRHYRSPSPYCQQSNHFIDTLPLDFFVIVGTVLWDILKSSTCHIFAHPFTGWSRQYATSLFPSRPNISPSQSIEIRRSMFLHCIKFVDWRILRLWNCVKCSVEVFLPYCKLLPGCFFFSPPPFFFSGHMWVLQPCRESLRLLDRASQAAGSH